MTLTARTVELQEVVRFASGGTPSKSNPANWGGVVPWVSAKDLKTLNLHDSQDHLTKLGAKATNLAPAGSVLVLVRGMTLLKDLPVGVTMRPMAFNQDVKALYCTDGLRPYYLAYYLISRKQEILQSVETAGHGTGRLDTDFLKTFPIELPGLDKQDDIIKVIGEWDTAIEKATALLAALEQRKQGLMQQLLTGRRRLKGFKAKWKMSRADQLFDDIAKRSQLNEQLLSVTQDRGVIPRTMLVGRVTMPSGDVNSFKLVEPDNFVISLRSFQGGLEHSAYRGLVSPAYTVLEADTAKVHAPYFRQYFKSVDFLHRLSVAVVGIRDGKQISYTDFKSIKLPLPPLPEQEAIATLLDFADSEIGLAVQRAEQLRTQKRALMQKLLSGDWRMPKTAHSKEFSA